MFTEHTGSLDACKDAYTECHQNPTNGLVADTNPHKEERTLSESYFKELNNSPRFRKPERSWPCAQQPATCPVPRHTSPVHTPLRLYDPRTHCLPLQAYVLQTSLSAWGFLTKFLYIFLLHSCHIPCPSHPPSFHRRLKVYGEERRSRDPITVPV
jgi:hypothetical protein